MISLHIEKTCLAETHLLSNSGEGGRFGSR